jgi:methyl-accepting chemotaxis protein
MRPERKSSTAAADAARLAAYDAAFDAIAGVCNELSNGNLEARVPALGDEARLVNVRYAINHLADVTDAFVREARASLTAASAGRYYRQFLDAGLPGSFASGARRIDDARASMREAAEHLDAEARKRSELAETVFGVSSQVATASTELGASAGVLADATRIAVEEATLAAGTVHSLESSAAAIEHAATMIRQVAAQTRLLALNATIEAARAGDAGRGFAVVASEVKSLADEAGASSEDIARQIEATQSAVSSAVEAIERVTATIHAMDEQVEGIAAAAAGGTGGISGLSQMAEELRIELERLVKSEV